MCPTCLLFATLAVSLSAASAWFAYRRGHSRGHRDGFRLGLAAYETMEPTRRRRIIKGRVPVPRPDPRH